MCWHRLMFHVPAMFGTEAVEAYIATVCFDYHLSTCYRDILTNSLRSTMSSAILSIVA
jgi:hypothetical protein